MRNRRGLVIELGDAVVFYKIGLELFMTGGYFELLHWLVEQGKKVFVDLKFFDVPETVRSAVRALAGSGASFATIHGNQAIMEAAVKDKGDLKILAVTVLTSLDRGDLDDLGFCLRGGQAGAFPCPPGAGRRGGWHRFVRARGAHDPPRAWGPADGGHARHTAGREQAGGRPEAHRRCRPGLQEWRRLHRGRPADPPGGKPRQAALGHPADHPRGLPSRADVEACRYRLAQGKSEPASLSLVLSGFLK
jgi:hypothetical protein